MIAAGYIQKKTLVGFGGTGRYEHVGRELEDNEKRFRALGDLADRDSILGTPKAVIENFEYRALSCGRFASDDV
jgi:hypothetical protein